MNCLNVLYWNAQGLLEKIIDLYVFLVSNHIDIACISETFLKPAVRLHSHPDYRVYRLDRDNRGGGVAIIVRRHLKHEIVPHLNLKLIECIGAKIQLSNSSHVTIYSCYLPGSTTNALVRDFYKQDIQRLTNTQSSYFACGDFNSKHRHWNCSRANTAGSILYSHYVERDFVIAFPPTPTYYPDDQSRLPSTLDLVITNHHHGMTEPACLDLSSDHRTVSFQVKLGTSAESTSQGSSETTRQPTGIRSGF